MDDIAPEQQAKINITRILIGDSTGSIFYPILTDEEYFAILELEHWDVKRAARRAGLSISMQLTMLPYRERTGDIEVWNNASLAYYKALQDFLDDSSPYTLPPDLIPYAAGISRADVEASNCNPDKNRSPLAQITPCTAWWTRVDRYPKCCDDGTFIFLK